MRVREIKTFKSSHIYGKIGIRGNTRTGLGKTHSQKIPERNLSFHSGLINEDLPLNRACIKHWKRELWFFVFFKYPVFSKRSQGMQSTGNMVHSKKQNKSPETYPKETQVSNLFYRLKTTVSNILNELKRNKNRHLAKSGKK